MSDRNIEYRLSLFCKLLGMNSEDFHIFINKSYVHYFWLTIFKYQVSSIYTFSSLTDYNSDVLAKIKLTGSLDNFEIAVPNSEQDRLVRQFEMIENMPEPLKLDVIVLTQNQFLSQFSSSAKNFVLSYENSTFKVWVRRN